MNSIDCIIKIIWSLDNKKHNPIIIGSYIYKYIINGEGVNDIDLVTKNYMATYYDITKLYSNIYCKFSWSNAISLGLTGSNMSIDIIDMNTIIRLINQDGPTPINSLVYTTDGIRHISEIDEFQERILLPTKDPKKEREWMINNIKQKKYCVWPGMRDKDKEYFKNWSIIDFKECKEHFIHN